MTTKPVPIIPLVRDEDGTWLLFLPIVEGGEDLAVVDTLDGLPCRAMEVVRDGEPVTLPVYMQGDEAFVTWRDAYDVTMP